MGDPLAPEVFDAFGEELVKEAVSLGQVGKFLLTKMRAPTKMGLGAVAHVGKGTRGFMKDTGEAGRRFFNPISGLKKGWEASAPTHRMAQEAAELGFKGQGGAARAVQAIKPQMSKIEQAMAAAKASGDKPAFRAAKGQLRELKGHMGKVSPGGEHLLQPSTTMAEAAKTPGLRAKGRAIADELSRRGWTGAGGPGVSSLGGATKYLPVGQKGLNVGMYGGLGIPGVIAAEKATPTGEGGALERGLGLAGSVGGMVLGGGLGLVPALGLWYGAESAGSRLGRVLDRTRAGANPGQALLAPSPEEARAQMANIQRHYG